MHNVELFRIDSCIWTRAWYCDIFVGGPVESLNVYISTVTTLLFSLSCRNVEWLIEPLGLAGRIFAQKYHIFLTVLFIFLKIKKV